MSMTINNISIKAIQIADYDDPFIVTIIKSAKDGYFSLIYDDPFDIYSKFDTKERLMKFINDKELPVKLEEKHFEELIKL